jgi:hypothetical protein
VAGVSFAALGVLAALAVTGCGNAGTRSAARAAERAAGSVLVQGTGEGTYSVYDSAGRAYLGVRSIGDPRALAAGKYVVEVSGVRRPIVVLEGQGTTLRLGSVLVQGTGQSTYSVYDAAGRTYLGFRIIGDVFALFAGDYLVEVSGVRKPLVVREGQRTVLTLGSVLVQGAGGGTYRVYDAGGTAYRRFQNVGDARALDAAHYRVDLDGDRRPTTIHAGQHSVLVREK